MLIITTGVWKRGNLDGSMLVIYYMGVVHTAKEGGKLCKIYTIVQTATQDRRTHHVAVTPAPARSCPRSICNTARAPVWYCHKQINRRFLEGIPLKFTR